MSGGSFKCGGGGGVSYKMHFTVFLDTNFKAFLSILKKGQVRL